MNTLLLEIGTEEIPAGYIQPALDSLAATLSAQMASARIDHGVVETSGTPRRLVVSIDAVAPRQRAMTALVNGPPERIAFDDQGEPTLAARKFAEKVGVAVSRLAVVETAKGRYLGATVTDRGSTSKAVLQKILPAAILSTAFPKTMRWSTLSISFARPIQSVTALLGKTVIPFTLGAKIKSGRYAWGHMFMHPRRVKIERAEDYADTMLGAQVIVDMARRKAKVQEQIDAAAKAMGGTIVPDAALLDTVCNLVEMPFATGGRFDDLFLKLPREILITSMREHQKYFAVVDDNDRLRPCFVAVNNTRVKDPRLVAKGHERVLRARLADAEFFFRGDLKVPLDDWRRRLKRVLFQARLGSMHAKVERVRQLGAHLTGAEERHMQQSVARAAQLCKIDLVSQVVGEFAKLQGIMGRVYASEAGESEEVAMAIEEHYRPVYSGGPLPRSRTGAWLAVADKLDTICGCFCVGLKPTGASDPYALRRQGIGIVQIVRAHDMHLSLKEAIQAGLKPFDDSDRDAVGEAIYAFIRNRVARILIDEGHDKDVVAAVTAASIDKIPDVWPRSVALQRLKGEADFEPLAVAFKRVVNILRKRDLHVAAQPDSTLFETAAEETLFEAYGRVKARAERSLAAGDPGQALRVIASLREPVDRFFDEVLVMTDDETLRANRLALLNQLAGLFESVADFSKITT